jgi:Fic family protein
MAYIETIKKGKQKYYYLARTIRYDKKFKKIRWFLGKGNISKKELEVKAKQVKLQFDKKVAEFKKTPSLYELNKENKENLKKIKKEYKNILKKLSKVEYEVIEKQHLIQFTFNTNAIEGSTISLKETAHILEDEIVPSNHKIREIHEVENTKKTYQFLKTYNGKMSSVLIKKIHLNLTYNILNEDSGKFRRIQVYMGGSQHKPPGAKEVKNEMKILMRWIKSHQNLHPVVLAAYTHHYFIAIHPFIDGNGRTGRLLLNFMLMNSGFPPICIKLKERLKYIALLEKARDGNPEEFIEFIIHKVKEAFKDIVDDTNQ